MPGGMMKDFPTGSIDLWPNSKQNNKKQGVKLDLLWTESDEGQLRAILLKSCLPRDNVACQERRLGATSEQHVGILRPPGVFGSVFEKFVEVAIEESRRHRTTTTNAEDMEDMVIQVSPSVEMIQDYTLTQILRPTVLPILLEAIDLVLETTDIETGYTPLDTTVDDLVGTVRLLIRWHCHMAALAVDTAFLTMSLDEFLAYPVTTTKDLVQFLGWHDAPLPPDETMLKHNQKNMDELAERVFRRIDECTHHLHVLLATTTSEWLDGAVKRAIRAELQSGMCGTQRIRPDGEVIVRSRVTELVAAFLGDGSTAIPCALYPHARMCAATS